MKKMVNKQRVRRIKNFIYALIMIVFLLPLVFMAILTVRMVRIMDDMSDKLDAMQLTVSQQASPPAPNSGYVIEPEGQSVKNESPVPKTVEDEKTENASNLTPAASGNESEAGGSPPEESVANGDRVSQNNGAPGINVTQSGTLDSSSLSGAGGGPLVDSRTDNVQTGNAGNSNQGYNGNPLTGR